MSTYDDFQPVSYTHLDVYKRQVQILAPMYRGQAGINNLNTIMQDLLNPKEKANQFAFNDIFFRKNDKILHLVNDTELNVFNGDIGIITAVSYTHLDVYKRQV